MVFRAKLERKIAETYPIEKTGNLFYSRSLLLLFFGLITTFGNCSNAPFVSL